MSLSREAMLDVMAYVDGELDGDALDRTEALLASDEDAARLALELRTLGDCVRVVQTDRSQSKNPDEIADDVMKALDKNVVPVASLADRRRNAIVVGTISGALAIAAAWFLLSHNAQAPLPGEPVNQPVAQASAQPAVQLPAIPADSANAVDPEKMAAEAYLQSGVDVESVESPAHEVSVFYVPATASANPNASSVVVWIGEDETKK
jgi:anti-sigma factor RsiW